MSTYAPSGSFSPQLAVSGNNVYVVWQEDDAITGNQDIFFKKSTDGGDTFTDEINLSKDPGGSGDPQIHVSGRNLYIVWDVPLLEPMVYFSVRVQMVGILLVVHQN